MRPSHYAAADEAPTVLPAILGRQPLNRAARAILLLPIWAQALLVYLVSRVISLGIFAAVLRSQQRSPWTTGNETSLNDFLNFWDAGWYQNIAENWYPSVLPMSDAGTVAQNNWAFYPLHPMLVRNVQLITGLDYQVASPLLSTVFAGIASVVILVLFRLHTTPGRALAALAFVFTFPASPVFSTGYAESLTILLLAICLLLIVQRHYLLAIPFVFFMDLSRPIGVGFAFFMLLHLIDRFLRRRSEPYPVRQVVASWTLGVLSCVAALLLPAYAALRTGSLTAYTDTEAAWTGHSRVLVQWVEKAQALTGPFGAPLLILVVVLFFAAILSPAGRSMGRVGQQFIIGYGVYLLLFFTPQTSTLRLMLPMLPLALVLAQSRSWTNRIVIIVCSIVFQIVWIRYLWHYAPPVDFPP